MYSLEVIFRRGMEKKLTKRQRCMIEARIEGLQRLR